MAKLTFGTLELKAVAKESPIEMPTVPAQKAEPVDLNAMVQEAVSKIEIPKYDETFGSALKQLREEIKTQLEACKKDQKSLQEHMEDMEGDLVMIRNEIESLPEQQAPSIVQPEVKNITHVKDVSKEVMEHVEANKQQLKSDLMNHANHIVAIEAKLKTQKIINMVLVGALILTILSRLF